MTKIHHIFTDDEIAIEDIQGLQVGDEIRLVWSTSGFHARIFRHEHGYSIRTNVYECVNELWKDKPDEGVLCVSASDAYEELVSHYYK